jgi:septum formation protein
MMPELILGSSSVYRAAALRTLGLPFRQISPDINETPEAEEQPDGLARRLAVAKATWIARQNPEAVVIGSDQVGWCQDHLLSKPGSLEAAKQMLMHNAGWPAIFYTALAISRFDHDGCERTCVDLIKTELKFRNLSTAEIQRYVEQDRATDSAGGFKAESLGIALFEYIRADDPSALIGLPLITLTSRLKEFGINPLALSTVQ